MRARPLVGIAFLLISSGVTKAQQHATTTSAEQGPALAQRAAAALTPYTAASDVTITGTVNRTIGSSSETGNFTLKALGTDNSRFDLVLSEGTRSEVFYKSSVSYAPSGVWIGTNGISHPIASHNCLAGRTWFFPALSILAEFSNPNIFVTYVGAETRNEAPVLHLRYSFPIAIADKHSAAVQSQLSVTDVYLDPSSYLTVSISFNVHPDDNMLVNIPVEIDFSDYRVVEGVQVPFKIERYLNGTLMFDFNVQSVSINTGLSSSEFSTN